jgi:hypothetical protein
VKQRRTQSWELEGRNGKKRKRCGERGKESRDIEE